MSLVALLNLVAHSQQAREPLSAIPPALRETLAERLALFVEYQRTQNWQGVADLLGAGRGERRYTPEQKDWLIEQFKRMRLVSFVPKRSAWSTAILSLPPDKRYYFVEGVAGFAEASNATTTLPASLVAYRQNGDWYFLPFVRNECGEIRMPSLPDFTPEGRAEESLPELSLETQPGLPVEVFDVSVTRANDSPCSRTRKLEFKIKNVGRKTISGFGFSIRRRRRAASTSVGAGLQNDLKRGETTAFDAGTFTAEGPHIFRVEFVRFSDWTFWRAGKSRTNNRKR